MLENPRWFRDCDIMDELFPSFIPFVRDGTAGFEGKLPSPRSTRVYFVTLKAHISRYPESEPAIYISPHPEPHHWTGPDHHLCVRWEAWNPAEHTFADALLIAAKYIAEFE